MTTLSSVPPTSPSNTSEAIPPKMATRNGSPWWLSAAGAFGLVGAWEWASGRLVSAYFVSSPSAIAQQIFDWILSGYLFRHLVQTMWTTLVAFAIAGVLGIALAVLLGSNIWLDRVFAPFINALFAIPKVALAPLLIFWLGVGVAPCLALAILTGFFMVFFNAYSGIRHVRASLLDTVSVMGATPLQRSLKVRLPAAAPFIALGLNQGLIYAFHGAVVGEMTASNTGLGYIILYASTDMDSTGVFAGLVVLGAFAYLLVVGLNRLSRLAPGVATP